jgi:hemerythrin-like metal-binding protein
MSGIREFNAQANNATDHEHQVQLELLSKLCKAVDSGESLAAVNQLLGELMAYSEVHFASEELLMRMKSYDDFEAHQEDHFHMLEVLRHISEQATAGQPSLVAGKVREALGFLEQHIATRDERLADYVRHNL